MSCTATPANPTEVARIVEAGSNLKSAPSPVPVRLYLSAEQLAQLTPWSTEAIEKMIQRGALRLGLHFFQPSGRRGQRIFRWDRIVELIEGRSAPVGMAVVVNERGCGQQVPQAAESKGILDVEEASTALQRLLG